LEDGIVIAEQNDRNFTRLADFMNEIDDLGERRVCSQGALGSALNRGAVGERIAEGDAKFDDVSACLG
jgi:hypothetical protein